MVDETLRNERGRRNELSLQRGSQQAPRMIGTWRFYTAKYDNDARSVVRLCYRKIFEVVQTLQLDLQ